MAAVQAFFGSAIRAAASGYSANDFVNLLRAEGMGTRRSEVLKLYKVARQLVSVGAEEPFRNPHAVPTGEEMSPWPTNNATGVRQNVRLVYQDKVTGDYKVTFWSTITANGIPRSEAVATAINAYAGTAERYNQILTGAFHSSAQLMTPGLLWTAPVKHTGLSTISRKECHHAWWRSTRKVRSLMMVMWKFKNGASVALYAGVQISNRGIAPRVEFSTHRKPFGNGCQNGHAKARAPWYGHTTLVMTCGYLACSKYSPFTGITLTGATLIATYPLRHGAATMAQSSSRIHGHGFRYLSTSSHRKSGW